MCTLELEVDDGLRRQCVATQFRFCLDELDKLAGTCRRLARTPTGRTRISSPYFALAIQLDADVVRLRDLLNDRMERAAAANRVKTKRDSDKPRRAKAAAG